MALELPEELRKVAENELGETPEVREAALKELKEAIGKLPDGPRKPHRTDDAYLLMYLRHGKFKVKRALEKITNMAKFLEDHKDDLANLCGEEFREFYAVGFMRVLKGQTKDGHRIQLLLPNNLENMSTSPREFGRTCLRWSVWSVFRMVYDPVVQVHGQVVLESFEGFTLAKMFHMQTMSAGWMRLSFYFLQKCAPFRMGGIWVAHQPSFMSVLWAMTWPFMKAKLRQRVRLLGTDVTAVHELVDPAVLPPEFGGTLEEDPMVWLEEQIAAEHAERAAACSVSSTTEDSAIEDSVDRSASGTEGAGERKGGAPSAVELTPAGTAAHD